MFFSIILEYNEHLVKFFQIKPFLTFLIKLKRLSYLLVLKSLKPNSIRKKLHNLFGVMISLPQGTDTQFDLFNNESDDKQI